MATCDINNGRSDSDCKERAGVKTVFFFRHSRVSNITRNGAGEITYFGNGLVFRFEQDNDHGLAIQEVVQDRGNESQYIKYQIDLTTFYVTPEYLEVLNNIKLGHWAIFFLDYHDNIRFMGIDTPMQEIGSVGQSGEAAGDTKYFNMTFTGIGGEYAPYLAPFTDYPFDNFPARPYPPYEPGGFDRILINATDHLLIDNLGNKLIYAG